MASCLCLLHVFLFLGALRALIYFCVLRAFLFLRALRVLRTFFFVCLTSPQFLRALRAFTCLRALFVSIFYVPT